jgi:hypothetical protein
MGPDNIDEFRIYERIKISSLKHRGNINEICDETGIEPEVVRKYLNKIKKDRDLNVNTQIAHNLMTYLFEGHQQRIVYIEEMLKLLRGSEQISVSDCCKLPMKQEKDSNDVLITKCRGCNIECKPMMLNQGESYNLKIRLLKELQEEDESLVDFAVKMGYSNAAPVERAPIVRQEFIVVGNGQQGKTRVQGGQIEVSSEEVKTLAQIEQMPPAEREKLKNDLMKEISRLKQEEPPTEGTPK